MKQRDEEIAKGWVQIVHTLPIGTEGGKQRMNCANTERDFSQSGKKVISKENYLKHAQDKKLLRH